MQTVWLCLNHFSQIKSRCFAPNGRFVDILSKLRPDAVEADKIRHLDGTVLGNHSCVADYNTDQRHGLRVVDLKDVSEDENPPEVVEIDIAFYTVLVGHKSALACHTILS